MTLKELEDEKTGNEGRKQWNSRKHPISETRQMLAGAIITIERLLNELHVMKHS